MSGERCTNVFRKLHPKPNIVSELKFALKKTQENVLRKEVERVREV